jgi:hypothetical protein
MNLTYTIYIFTKLTRNLMVFKSNSQMSFEDVYPNWHVDYGFIQNLSLDELLILHSKVTFYPKTSPLYWELLKIDMEKSTK